MLIPLVMFALAAAGPLIGCVVMGDEPLGSAVQADEAQDFSNTPLGPPSSEQTPHKTPERMTIPLTRGAMLVAQIAACRRAGRSNADVMRCMASVLQGE